MDIPYVHSEMLNLQDEILTKSCHSTHVFERENIGKLSKCSIKFIGLTIFFMDSKTLVNQWTIAKFANVFPCQRFALSNTYVNVLFLICLCTNVCIMLFL